jgi:hypothetical protein
VKSVWWELIVWKTMWVVNGEGYQGALFLQLFSHWNMEGRL